MLRLSPRLRAAPTRYLRPARRGGLLALTKADGLMLGVMLVWGINIAWVKVVVRAAPPIGFGLLRYLLAAGALFALLRRREGSLGVRRGDLGGVVLVGAVGLGCYQLAFLLGIRLLSASLAAIILATTPLLTASIVALGAREPLPRRSGAALACSFAGVVAVILGGDARLSASWLGGVLMLGAALAVALSAVWARAPLRVYSSLRVTTWMCLFGSLVLLPAGLPELLADPGAFLTPAVGAAVAFTVLGGTIMGNLAWNYAVQRLGPTRTAAYTYLQPVVGVAIAVALLGERPGAAQLLGGGAVLLGLLLYPRPRPSIPSEAPHEP